MLLALLQSIEANGLREEGIFRVCASTKDVEKLKKEFDQRNYAVSIQDPHTAAALLKHWLR